MALYLTQHGIDSSALLDILSHAPGFGLEVESVEKVDDRYTIQFVGDVPEEQLEHLGLTPL